MRPREKMFKCLQSQTVPGLQTLPVLLPKEKRREKKKTELAGCWNGPSILYRDAGMVLVCCIEMGCSPRVHWPYFIGYIKF